MGDVEGYLSMVWEARQPLSNLVKLSSYCKAYICTGLEKHKLCPLCIQVVVDLRPTYQGQVATKSFFDEDSPSRCGQSSWVISSSNTGLGIEMKLHR